MNSEPLRHDWTLDQARELYALPLTELLFRAQTAHRQFHDPTKVQCCTLLSIKTGACPEDCAYCPQSAHHSTNLEPEKLLDVDVVLGEARAAKAAGATRFCMGAAWREVRDGKPFENVLEMVRGIRELGLEACCTLGMIDSAQAARLADAGLTAYNHNLDTGPGYYEKIISTRTYTDRLETLAHVREAGITLCSGGILGMGESIDDRLEMLCVLAAMDPHPESVPLNALVAVEGTPLEQQKPIDPFEMVRAIAVARILMPSSMVRLSAGRLEMSDETQALCFMAGANSIFTGERLLTTPNPEADADQELMNRLGLSPLEPDTRPGAGLTANSTPDSAADGTSHTASQDTLKVITGPTPTA